MDFELDSEWVIAIAMGVIEGFIVLFMMKFSGMGIGFRIFSALISVVLGAIVTKFIISR